MHLNVIVTLLLLFDTRDPIVNLCLISNFSVLLFFSFFFSAQVTCNVSTLIAVPFYFVDNFSSVCYFWTNASLFILCLVWLFISLHFRKFTVESTQKSIECVFFHDHFTFNANMYGYFVHRPWSIYTSHPFLQWPIIKTAPLNDFLLLSTLISGLFLLVISNRLIVLFYFVAQPCE